MSRALAILAAACLMPGAHAGEKKLTEKQMPASILAAFHEAYPAATIRGLAVETEHGRTTYEVESLDGKTRRDLSYLADGTLVEIEETIPASGLPASVLAAVKAKHPAAKILKAERDTKGAAVTYELHINEGGHRREVVFNADGGAQSR